LRAIGRGADIERQQSLRRRQQRDCTGGRAGRAGDEFVSATEWKTPAQRGIQRVQPRRTAPNIAAPAGFEPLELLAQSSYCRLSANSRHGHGLRSP